MKDTIVDDKIVITGISGRFPQCENLDQLKKALFDGVDLVKEDSTRYPAGIWNTPKYAATILNIDKFDASYFGIHAKQVTCMDPRQRILLEAVYESIIDAGYNPTELRGRKIGVYVGICNLSKLDMYYEMPNTSGYTNIGLSSAMASNRISYCFDLKGPSFAVDTACSSSTTGFVCAVNDMMLGETDGAIVCGTHLIQHPFETAEFNRLSMLSPEGRCKVFSTNRNGYVRAEGIICYFLQRESRSRRIYATVCGVKCNSDGFKGEGITFPSSEQQYNLMKELYESISINPNELTYFEAHGTGTPVGDIAECQAITSLIGEERTTPLLMGSVKSNLGHSEVSSGLCSLTKVIIAMESGNIPANLHTEFVDKTLPGVKDNKLEIVTENTKWDGGIVGVNCFGFGGTNTHIVLDSNKKNKQIENYQTYKNRLVQVSGRTEEAVLHFLDEIEKNQNDPEFLAMVDEIHKLNINGHNHRGYIVLGDHPVKEVGRYNKPRPIWFVYSGMGSHWLKMGKDLLNIAVFRNTINRCARALVPYHIDLMNIITSEDPAILDNISNCLSAIGAIEIALTDVLKSLNICPDGFCGHSLGEVGCAYADGQITPEQAVLLAYARGYSSENSNIIPGQMAAVGLPKDELIKYLPEGVYIACQNSKDSITISGSVKETQSLVEKLSARGVFTRIVKSAGIPFHTRYLKEAGELLFQFCDNVLKDPKPRSSRWKSSSVPPSRQNEEWAQLNGAEYHRNNFCNTVLLDQVYDHIPDDAIVVEIAPHGLLQGVLKRAMGPDVSHIPITNRSTDDNEKYFLSAVGKIYIAGGQPNLRNMYNDVTFPVSRGTKMLSPLVEWDHSISWFTGLWQNKDYFGKEVTVSLLDEDYSYLQGHEIDGRILMPATGYLDLVWDTFAKQQLKEKEEVPIIFENVKFKRTTVLSSGEDVKFLINITKQSGNFEIFESGSVVCTGVIRTPKNGIVEFKQRDAPNNSQNGYMIMKREDIYKECWLRRYVYKDYFQGLIECDIYGKTGKLEWRGKFGSFLDTMLQITVISQSNRDVMLPTGIQQITIDPVHHLNIVQNQECKGIPVYYNQTLNIIRSGGVEIIGQEATRAPSRQHVQEPPYLESNEFVQYQSSIDNLYDLETSLYIVLQIAIQNSLGLVKNINICEIVTDSFKEVIGSHLKPLIRQQALAALEYNTSTPETLDKKYEIIIINEAVLSFVNIDAVLGNLTTNGFILYVGKHSAIERKSLEIIFKSTTDEGSIILLRSTQEIPENYSIIDVSTLNFDWLEKIKSISKYENGHVVYLVSQEEVTGLIGLVKCLLTEPSELIIKAVSLKGKNEKFSLGNPFYRDQMKKNLVYNILEDNNWGTLVHIPIKPLQKKKVGNATIEISTVGDLSTLDWVERPFESNKIFESSELVYVYYSALNFKDVMVATGKIAFEGIKGIASGTLSSGLGFEFSGVTMEGKRVMGIIGSESMSLQVCNDPFFTWDVPSKWTLQEACTVPCVYATCYYALILRGQMKPGESILIHAGTGGIGLAAINIALSMGCRVYTTVSTGEKRRFLKNLFPVLDDKHIGNSRDTSFEIMIKENTNGRGVDLVLNSLADELFQASMRCLAHGGRFLEIGKVDLINSSPIPSRMFLNNISFHGVHLDKFFFPQNEYKKEIQRLLKEGIANGVVKPLPSIVFEENQVESAIRYLASGKHRGKVLIEIRKEEFYPVATPIRSISAISKISFSPIKSYILIGGLGGFGLELTDWLIKKGATKIILNSRRDVSNGYQAFCFQKWSQYKGITVKVDTNDSSILKGAENLINNAQKLGPVGGIFNMALVIRDALLMNQTVENFQEVFKAKIISGQNMDIVSRKLCPELEHFIVFSSIACGRGNTGQSNYGMANFALEELCKKRKREQLPGLAIQWGPIGDVGFLTRSDELIEGYKNLLPQKIESCLNVLEQFMLEPYTVTSSVVLTEKDSVSTTTLRTPVEAIAHILGIKNLDLVDKSISLSQLGLDSLMVSEIKQTLYRNFNVEYSPEEIRDLTLNSFIELGSSENKDQNTSKIEAAIPSSPYHNTLIIPEEPLLKMNAPNDCSDRNIFVIHPIEGNVDILKPLANKLNASVYGFQCTKDVNFDSIIDFASHYNEKVREIQPKGPYYICGYSYGCAVSTEMAIQFEKTGEHVNIVYIDGSPAFVYDFLRKTHVRQENSMETSQKSILKYFCLSFSEVDENEVNKALNSSTEWHIRLQEISVIVSKVTAVEKSKVIASAESFYKRIIAGYNYEPSRKTNGKVLLIRRHDNQFISENYELHKVSSSPVDIVKVNGDHITMLLGDNTQTVADAINKFF